MARLFALVVVWFALLGAGPAASAQDGPFTRHDSAATGELLPPRGTPTVRGQVVIGADDRIQVADTTVFPYSAIAFLELEDAASDVLGTCTGTFIGPDALLTAAHCLWDAESGNWLAEHIRVVPGRDSDFEPFGSQYASDWWIPDEYAATGSADWDWGVIKLPNDLLSLDTGWMSVTIAGTETLERATFSPAIVGYPADKPAGTMWGRIQPAFLQVGDFRLFYDIDTAPGQSGSAIWSAEEGPYLGLIVGIHTQGGAANSGARIDQELLDDVLAGCAVMECQVAVVDAPGSPSPGPAPLPPLPFRSYGPALSRD